jgi:hypothetical protein
LINLIPDPSSFDVHLRSQMLQMAKSRSAGMAFDRRKERRIEQLIKQDGQRSIMSLPREVLRSRLLKLSPEQDGVGVEDSLQHIEQLKERDPLAVLQDGSLAGEKGGQFNLMKLAPNFEMAMYLAQATGSCIVTDSPFRWTEVKKTIRQRERASYNGLAPFAREIESSEFLFPQRVVDIAAYHFEKTFAAYPALFQSVFKYFANLSDGRPKPNWEAQLINRFTKAHTPVQTTMKKARVLTKRARMSCVFPLGGIQDNTVNRLLLMSSSERHQASVPMAFFIDECVAN